MPYFLQDHLTAIIILLVLVMISSLTFSANLLVPTSSTTTNNSYNVMSYGAIGDGTSDDSQVSLSLPYRKLLYLRSFCFMIYILELPCNLTLSSLPPVLAF